MISFQIQSRFKLTEKRKIKKWLNNIAKTEGFEIGTLSYLFVTDDAMCEYNKKYLNHNSLTDIITFEIKENKKISGDVIISTERILANAKKFNVSFTNELYRVMAHGLLHLLGYNDKNTKEKKEIIKKENYYLKEI